MEILLRFMFNNQSINQSFQNLLRQCWEAAAWCFACTLICLQGVKDLEKDIEEDVSESEEEELAKGKQILLSSSSSSSSSSSCSCSSCCCWEAADDRYA
jgi:hypothetical protein